jgi:hypothetical protein
MMRDDGGASGMPSGSLSRQPLPLNISYMLYEPSEQRGALLSSGLSSEPYEQPYEPSASTYELRANKGRAHGRAPYEQRASTVRTKEAARN